MLLDLSLPEISGYSVSLILAILVFVFHGAVKEHIGRLFKNLTDKQIIGIYILFAFAVISIPGLLGVATSEVSKPQTPTITSTTNIAAPKSKEEVYLDAGKTVLDVGGKVIEAKQKKDSTKRANRDEMWVEQIGTAKDEDAIVAEYKKLQGIPHIFVFKQSRKSYLLITSNGHTEEESKASLPALREKLNGIESIVKSVDLISLCPLRKSVTEDKKFYNKKEHTAIHCFVCDK